MVLPFMLLALLIAATSAGAEAMAPIGPAKPEAVQKKQVLIVGSELDYPPFALVKPDGTADGFTVELWKAVAEQAGLKYQIRTGPFHEILRDFREGKVDVLINLAQSDERKQFSDFAVPHITSYGAIFVRRGDERIANEDGLLGKSLIVLNADLVHDYAVNRGLSQFLQPVDDAATAMRLLSSGKGDAVLLGKLAGLQTLNEQNITNIRPVATHLGVSQKFSFAVRKGNSELLAQINEGLAVVKTEGTYEQIHEKWFGMLEPRGQTFTELLSLAAPYLVGTVIVLLLLLGAYGRQVQLARQLAQRTESLRHTEAQLRHLNAALEDRVAQRTAELTVANEALRRSNTEWEQFAHAASHDLQEPLRQITSYAQLLARRYGERLGRDADEYIGFMVEGSSRMRSLIKGLQEFARVGRNHGRLVVEPINFNVVLEETLAHLSTVLQECGARVTHDPLPTVPADEALIEKLFSQLIANALKFRGQHPPRVHLSATRRAREDGGAEWVVSVRDNGIGIEPQYFERIFVIFQRLHTRAEYPGTGIGLTLCKKIVERHGGHIWVESAPQQGSTFLFTLPESRIPPGP